MLLLECFALSQESCVAEREYFVLHSVMRHFHVVYGLVSWTTSNLHCSKKIMNQVQQKQKTKQISWRWQETTAMTG